MAEFGLDSVGLQVPGTGPLGTSTIPSHMVVHRSVTELSSTGTQPKTDGQS